MRNWSHITSVCACSCWRCPYNVSQSITVSTTRLHTRARAHTLSDYSLASIIFKRKACSHMNRYRSGVSNTSVCVRACVCMYTGSFKTRLTHNIPTTSQRKSLNTHNEFAAWAQQHALLHPWRQVLPRLSYLTCRALIVCMINYSHLSCAHVTYTHG